MVAHDAVDPLVVKYLPELPVWDGKASMVLHLTPSASAESAVRT